MSGLPSGLLLGGLAFVLVLEVRDEGVGTIGGANVTAFLATGDETIDSLTERTRGLPGSLTFAAGTLS